MNYTAEYVARLGRMVARHLPLKHRFVCLTDQVNSVYQACQSVGVQCDTIRAAAPVGLFPWWAKLQLFKPRLIDGDRFLYLDIDTVIVGDITDVAAFGVAPSFALAPDSGNFPGRGALKTVHRFNSSVMVWDRDVPRALWDEWTPAVATRLWGDQDWIGEHSVDARTMPEEWFPRLSELGNERPGPDAKVVLCKRPKNVEAAKQHQWVRDAWR